MIIKKLTATFGCLENKTLVLRDGLNVVYAPNESGKSTWCAFIQAMLYGIDSAQREKGGVKPDKLRYAPWSGAPMAGEMEIEHRGEALTLTRRTKTASAPMREFSVVRTGSAGAMVGMRGADAGQMLTGVPKSVFAGSVFVRQGALHVENSAELEKRIEAIVSTGAEGASYSEADAQLRAWQRKRYYNRTNGVIPELDSGIAQRKKRLEELRQLAQERRELEERLSHAEQERARLTRELHLESDSTRRESMTRLESCRARARRTEDAYDAQRARTIEHKSAVEGPPFLGAAPERARAEAEADIKELKTLLRALPKRIFIAAALVLALAAGVLGAVAARPLFFVSGALFLAACGMAFVSLKRGRAVRIYENYLRGKYGCADAQGIAGAVERYEAEYAEYIDAAALEQELAKRVREDRAALEAAQNAMISSAGTQSGAGTALAQAGAQCDALRERLAVLRGKFSALGDPMVLEAELGELTARREERQEEYDALELAMTTLAQANDEVRQRFSPALGRRATEYMSILSGGRYDRLSFDRALNGRARLAGSPTDSETAYLSAGAYDQLYLALRLAIAELALPQESALPLILDDALVNFDEERMARALELLHEIAKARQVILFTCHEREKQYLQSRGWA